MNSKEMSVYVCGWDVTPDGYRLWVTGRPKVQASGPSYEVAEERLLDAIRDAGGAVTPVLEFDPPLPKSRQDSLYADPELYLIGGDSRFMPPSDEQTRLDREASLRRADAFFLSTVCRACGTATSPRNDRPLVVDHVEPGYDAAFGRVARSAQPELNIFSELFLNLFTEEENRRLQFRPVERRRTARKRFFELIGPAGIPFVAVADLPVSGWFCSSCGYRTFGCWVEGLETHQFVGQDDLAKPLPGLFTVGIPPGVQLCATGQRWRELVGKKGSRGFVSLPLGVVPARQVLRNPALESLESQQKRR
jgi:hypothetical protein